MRNRFNNFLVFVLSLIFGQKLLVLLYPTAEFIGASKIEWLNWFLDPHALAIVSIYALVMSMVCYFWLKKLRLGVCGVCGFFIGMYFSIVFFPHDKKTPIENFLLPSDPSLWSVIVLYLLLLVFLPLFFIVSLSKMQQLKI